MAKYADLKDYLQNEQTHRIRCELDTYIKSKKFNSRVNKLTIKTVRCEEINDFEVNIIVGVETLLTFEIGNKGEALYYYNVNLCVDIENSIFDIKDICIQEVSKGDLIDGNLLNQFMLPDIAKANVEESGESIHCDYSKNAVYDGYMLPVESIILHNDIPVYYSDLPDNCFGRIYFRSATAVVFNKQPYFNKLINMSMKLKPGNIILNKNRYELGSNDDELITIAHELVHWKKHQKYYRLLEILESEAETMSCDIEPIVFDDSMTPIQKAHFYAECQADALAFRVAMPKYLVEKALQKIEENSEPYKYKTDYYEDIVKKISQLFGVSRDISKQRLRQLGYDWADSIFLRVNNKYYDSFSFAPGTLKEDKTFVINRENYERLIMENMSFAELINSGKLFYLGHVVCKLDAKYISVSDKNGNIQLVLSDYAREHADECCIKFPMQNKLPTIEFYEFYGQPYLNYIPEFNEVIPESFELCTEDTGVKERTIKDIKEFNDNLTTLNSDKCQTFANTLIFHMKRLNIDTIDLGKNTNLSSAAIRKYCEGVNEPTVQNIMALCIGLELEPEYCYDMFEKAKYNIREDTMRNRAYRFVFNHTFCGLEECNKILCVFGQGELPDHHRNSAK